MTTSDIVSALKKASGVLAIGIVILGGGSALSYNAAPQAIASAGQLSPTQIVTHRTVRVANIDIHYREAGNPSAPTLLLLHGFPSSSHMFRDLIPQLADRYHVIAPDYPGFGTSGQPDLTEFAYSFSALADVMGEFTQKVGIKNYVLYIQDFGGPVGFRMAVAHPERVRAMIIQNTTVHGEGWNPDIVKQFAPFWKNRDATTEAPIRAFLKPETTQWQYTQGATLVDRVSPDAWVSDEAGLARPGNDLVQLQYLWNYQDNVAQYPVWQNYLKTTQPPTLIVWGKNDPFFTMAGVEALKTLLPKSEVHLYEAGHFALETHAMEISSTIHQFLAAVQ